VQVIELHSSLRTLFISRLRPWLRVSRELPEALVTRAWRRRAAECGGSVASLGINGRCTRSRRLAAGTAWTHSIEMFRPDKNALSLLSIVIVCGFIPIFPEPIRALESA